MRQLPHCLLLAALCSTAAYPVYPSQVMDPTAMAERLEETMGGAAFANARVLHFTWGVERDGQQVVAYDHSWDRWTGDYRISGTDRDSGKSWLALFNVDSREGRVWLGEDEVTGEDRAGQLERAYGRFINDTYWLLMPWKWRDPGVNLESLGPESIGDKTVDVVELSFGDVGLTSNDRYRGYVDRESGRMVRWSYVLQTEEGEPGSGEATVWDWDGWVEVEPGVWFSERKVRQGGEGPPAAITTTGVELHAEPTRDELAGWFQAD